ncbi:hypothetical protein JKF63_04308 [Porcisia hertigi]|uniref:J domain-containing protein n=1 Tax=Porcisia hertigi TaxID=2761500 RepID=A0A836INR6_9TRYP|nr:hypothetical protein JKF63_04308 [Porcisia hertigi]
MAAVQLAKSILAADGQPFATLSLAQGLPPVTSETPVPEARRNYMRLAGVIHPDRLQSSFDKATEAFQCLVRAFECFADPKLRKHAAAAAAKKLAKAKVPATAAARGTKVATSRPSPTTPASPKSQKMQRIKSKVRSASTLKKSRRATGSEEEEDSEPELTEEEESDTEGNASDASAADEEGWEAWAAAGAEPEVSTNRTPIGKPRVGGLYQPTTVGCPKCRSLWESDSRPQYSLFMGHWGKKVHCQLCLFQFGCATALHACPHCSAPFEYDVSMYDVIQTCQRCKKQFGFPYYPVNQHLIDQVALEEWRERMDRQKTSEREARARARRGGASDDASAAEEEMQLLVGTCIMEERCPLCNRRVKSKHRSHVEECKAKTAEERAASTEKVAGKSSRATPPAKKAVKAQGPRAAKATPKPRVKSVTAAVASAGARAAVSKSSTTKGKKAAAPLKRKRRRDDTESSEDSDSDSEEDEVSSESSFDDDDDDSSDE